MGNLSSRENSWARRPSRSRRWVTSRFSSRARSPGPSNVWGLPKFEARLHRQYRHPDGRATTVPVHPGRDISPSLLRVIARDIGMDVRDFVARR
ncbi:MAG TPA: type II toxin-antitoxin system HicA family toxin [Polyangia bacterium]|nr:type II toxin-antitoxin system HicA family toxin [Polyangia bacterium]